MSFNASLAVLDAIRRVVDEHGLAAVYDGIAGGRGPVGYTIGLSKDGLPEVVIFGLAPGLTEPLLMNAAALVREHQGVPPDDALASLVTGTRLCAVTVEDSSTDLPLANRFFQIADPVPAVQLVYTDVHGLFPWERGSMLANLPVLGDPLA